MNRKKSYIIFTAIALVLIVAIMLFNRSISNDIELKKSDKSITVRYINEAKEQAMADNLSEINQEEIWDNDKYSIVEGTVETINNIEIKIGDNKVYDSIIKIKVNDSLKGKINVGDTISALAGCNIVNEDIWQEDTYVNSCMEEGDKGFFILYQYEENDTIEESGKVLFLSDLAEYGFGDSMRFAFIDKKEEIVYSKLVYTDLQKADDLNDVRKYILSKIEK